MLKDFLRVALLVGALAIAALAGPATASAEERYSDADSAYLRVTSRILQPVGNVLDYEIVTAVQSGGTEQISGKERLPLAYRDAVKRYTLRQHRRDEQQALQERAAR